MGTFSPGFVPGSDFFCRLGTFSIFFVPKLCLVGTFLSGFVPGKCISFVLGTFSVFFVPKWCLVGTFLPGFVPGKCIPCVLGTLQSGFVFRASRSRQRQTQRQAGAGRGRGGQVQPEPARACQGQSGPTDANICREGGGYGSEKENVAAGFSFFGFAVFRKSNRVNLPFIGKAPGRILFVTNISECVRF